MDTTDINTGVVPSTGITGQPRGSLRYHATGRFGIQNIGVQTQQLVSNQAVDVHFADDFLNRTRIVKTMVREIYRSTDSQAIAGFAGSIIAACFEDFKEILKTSLTRSIGGVNIIDDSNREALLFELDPPEPLLVSFMIMAQIILIIYKNISQTSYDSYLISRLRALKAIVGMPDNERIYLVMPIAKASMIRSRLGADIMLRRKLLEILLAHRDEESPVGSMCNYICGILDWHEMTSMKFVLDTIVATDSPVLYDVRISPDVLNFLDAAKEVHSSTYYGFFKIRERRQFKRSLIERSKFPILASVAYKIKSQTSPSLQNYRGVPERSPPLVDMLVAKHNRYILSLQPDLYSTRLQFLRHFDDTVD